MTKIPQTSTKRGLDLFSDMNDIYEGFFRPFRGVQNLTEVLKPAIDVVDEKNQLLVKADMPGMEKENIEVTLENSVLTIKGQKEEEITEEKGEWIRQERSYGSFVRRLQLGEDLDEDRIDASYRNGVLQIVIPKKENPEHKTVKVNVH